MTMAKYMPPHFCLISKRTEVGPDAFSVWTWA